VARLIAVALSVAVVQGSGSVPLGLDVYMPVPARNPLSAEKTAMGRRLFFDRRLSRNGSISCATCHDPDHGFADSRPVATGIDGRVGRRNVPSLVNRGYGRMFFWDGRSRSLDDQVLKPIDDPDEMDLAVDAAAGRVALPVDEISRALASYVRSILSGESRFDYFAAGDETALSSDERAGLDLFRGRARCVNCHVGFNFTDEQLHNTGVAWNGTGFTDEGGGRGTFKTPTLRDVARTAPYMHDGSLATLEEVVEFYDRGGRPNADLDPEIHQLKLTPAEKRTLVSFLQSLNGRIRTGA
jgi:cytochrome c peroxidase